MLTDIGQAITSNIARCALIAVIFFPRPAAAADIDENTAPALLNINAGFMNINDHGDETFRAGLEYRFKPFSDWKLTPSVGALAADDDTVYVCAELRRDFAISPRWLVIPSFGAGWFNNEGKDLGHDLEFRSGLEIAFRFENNYRVGLALFHLSNSSLSDINPGTECLVLSVSIPMD